MVLFNPLCPLKFYSIHFSPFSLIQSTSVRSIHFGPILPTLVLFGPHLSYSVYSVHFSPMWSILFTLVHFQSYSVNFVHFGSIRSILSTSVLFGPHLSFSVHFGLISQLQSSSVQLGLVWTNLSTLVLICPFVLIQFTLVQLSPLRSTLFHLVYTDHFSPFWSTLIYFCALTLWEKTCLGWKHLF